MKNFKQYLEESAKNHVYVIKFAIEPTAEQVSIIEEWLNRFELRNATKVAVIENDAKDFIDIPNRKVYAFEVTLGVPVSQYILLQDLKIAANISEKYMVVRSAMEPIQQYAEHDSWSRAQDKMAKEKGLKPAARLSTDRLYANAEQPAVQGLFGDEYNKKFLTYLAGVADSRPAPEVQPSAPLFDWIKVKEDISPGEPHQDTSDFNAHIDTPKPVAKGNLKAPLKDEMVASHSEMTNNALPDVKFFQNAKTNKKKDMVKPARKV